MRAANANGFGQRRMIGSKDVFIYHFCQSMQTLFSLFIMLVQLYSLNKTLTATGQASGNQGLASVAGRARERERERVARCASAGSATRMVLASSSRVKPRTPHAASQSQHRARAVNVRRMRPSYS